MTDIWPGSDILIKAVFRGNEQPPTGVRFYVTPPIPDAERIMIPEGDISLISSLDQAYVYQAKYRVDISGIWACRAECDGPLASASEYEFTVRHSLT